MQFCEKLFQRSVVQEKQNRQVHAKANLITGRDVPSVRIVHLQYHCFISYYTLALLPLIPACFHLHRRTPFGLPANLSNWFCLESAPADMLSHSSSVQHSSGTLSLQTCKHHLSPKIQEEHWKHTGQHTSTQQSFAFCHEVFHDEPCMMPNYTHLAQLATLFYAFSSLPSTSSSSLLLLPFFYFFFCSKFCVGIVDCHFR